MKNLLFIWLLISSFSVANAQDGLPVWPIATGAIQTGATNNNPALTAHQSVDWTVPSPSAINIPNTGTNRAAPTQAGINACNELMFYAMHNGDLAAVDAELQIFSPTGVQLTLTGGEMNASAGDDEIQIVRRPGFSNQWFVIYNLAPPSWAHNHPAYQACYLAYSLIEVTGNNASYVLDASNLPIQDKILSVGGTNFQYFNGKATSRTSVSINGHHDIYAQRRSQGFGGNPGISADFQIDRFMIDGSDAIVHSATSSIVNGYSFYLMAAGSPIELSPTEDRLAVMARTQAEGQQQIYMFDPLSFGTAPDIITINDLYIQFNTAPLTLIGTSHQASVFNGNGQTGFEWLENFDKKISGLEFSPNGDYLYITGGGYVQGNQQNLTYLGQIDLNATTGTDYHVRLQVQTVNNYSLTTGGGDIWGQGNLTNHRSYRGMARIESCYNGNLYFTKSNSTKLWVFTNPNNQMTINMIPSQIDFGTAGNPNIAMNGITAYMPDQIDGFDYGDTDFQNANFDVSSYDCNGNCIFQSFSIVNAVSNTITATYTTDACPDNFELCVHIDSTYDIVTNYGVTYPGAITNNASVNYPSGEVLFDISFPTTGIPCDTCDVTANFAIEGDLSCTTYFYDLSVANNNGTSLINWVWDFGDPQSISNTATGQSAGHTFSSNGTYIVCLTVTGMSGLGICQDTYCTSVTITDCVDSCGVIPNFGIEGDISCTSFFYDQSVVNNNTTIIDWAWNFGDSQSNSNLASGQNAGHTFSGNGSYTVCLTVTVVTGQDTCQETFCDNVIITDCPCEGCGITPMFTYEGHCTFSFVDMSLANNCTTITGWSWDFGDPLSGQLQNTSTNQNPIHTFSSNGIYEVCLTVFGNDGFEACVQTICIEIEVRGCEDDQSGGCIINPNFGYEGNCTYTFYDLSTSVNSTNITNWSWDFGDPLSGQAQNIATGQYPTHTFSSNGTYTVCLTVFGNNGFQSCVETICFDIIVTGCENDPCEGCEITPMFLYEGYLCTYSFIDISTANNCTNITGWSWNFGDPLSGQAQNSSTSQFPNHTFSANGTYTVCLTVFGDNGFISCVQTYCTEVTVTGCGFGQNPNSIKLNDFEVTAVPNPATSHVSFNLKNGDPNREESLIIIYDTKGNAVYKGQISFHSQNSVDISFLSTGIYFYHVISDGMCSKTEKLIIQNN